MPWHAAGLSAAILIVDANPAQGSTRSKQCSQCEPNKALLSMKRRQFVKSSLAAAGVAKLSSVIEASAAEAGAKAAREFYELRLYHLRRGPKQQLFDDFCRAAAVPA